MAVYKFNKFRSLYDETIMLYALSQDGMEKIIDGVKFIEVTPDFKTVQWVRADSLQACGCVSRDV